MSKKLTCAKCGEKAELCGSVKIHGIQQPRMCKPCMIHAAKTNDYKTDDALWVRQLAQVRDFESLRLLLKEADDE